MRILILSILFSGCALSPIDKCNEDNYWHRYGSLNKCLKYETAELERRQEAARNFSSIMTTNKKSYSCSTFGANTNCKED